MIRSLPTKTLISFILNIVLVVALLLIIFISKKELPSNIINRDKMTGYVYTSPILDCEAVSEGGSTTVPHKEASDEIQKIADKYNLSDFSVYFRDLNNGPWVGINEKEFFSPASLMKTPILIGFLKYAESNPAILDAKVVATSEYFDFAIKQNFEVKTRIKMGETYTLRDVAEIMITDSDNVAVLMLSKYIKEKDMKSLFESVGISTEDKFLDVDIRVKDFASFFRVLYNASYLNREMSELALSMLAKSSFTSGIVSGVPPGTPVAHKYGERSLETKDSTKTVVLESQLHDCGIVYAETRPYILCIMTKGKDFENQEHFIAEVSDYVYQEVIK